LLATTISKLFEHYMLSCISPLLYTTNNQFSIKLKHGIDMCIFYLSRLCLIMQPRISQFFFRMLKCV